jgi:hypothetical protein
MKDQIEFTPREHYVMGYCRDPQLSRHRRLSYDGSFLLISLAFVAWGCFKQDFALGFVGYVLLFWRVATDLFKSQGYVGVYRSILDKYEAKLKELSERLESNRG